MKIIMNGAGGRLGQLICEVFEESEHEIAAMIDKKGGEGYLTDLTDFTGDADLIIDASHHTGTHDLLTYAIGRNLPVIVCTTGQDDAEKAEIKAASDKIPMFFSANMSLGVATLVNLAKQTAALFPNADIEIVEQHHNRKLDAPSGTALMIAEALCEVRPDAQIVEGRAGQHKREKNEIGIASLRLGSVVGIHEVIVSTESQTITLKHEAHSRKLFAEGALSAAEFMLGKPAGMYTMNEMTKA
ncbi:MAG: 4-hydroxy-tetrahydrodipicolinate reductase [Clostridia bacterium]|nr:4-hydroxy-tetrahydrodipicolinate reductase [Clostridia bacterium]